jgi:hypothetical protein
VSYAVQTWESNDIGWSCAALDERFESEHDAVAKAIHRWGATVMEYRIVNLDEPHASPLLVTIERER